MSKYYLMVGNETVKLDDITIFNNPMTRIDNLVRFTSAFKDQNELLSFLKQCNYISQDNNGIVNYSIISLGREQKILKERIIYSDNAKFYDYNNIIQIILDNATNEHFMDALTKIVYDRYSPVIARLKKYYIEAEEKFEKIEQEVSYPSDSEEQSFCVEEAEKEMRSKKRGLSSMLQRKKELDKIKESIEKISLSYEETTKKFDALDEKSLIETLINSDPNINHKEALLAVQEELQKLDESQEGYKDLFDLINLLLKRQTKSYELVNSERYLLECADEIIKYARFNPLFIPEFKEEQKKEESIVPGEFITNLIEEDSFEQFKNKIMLDSEHAKKDFINLMHIEAIKRLIEAKCNKESEDTINQIRIIIYALNAELGNSTGKVNLGYLFYHYEKTMRELFKRLNSKYVSSYIDRKKTKAHS